MPDSTSSAHPCLILLPALVLSSASQVPLCSELCTFHRQLAISSAFWHRNLHRLLYQSDVTAPASPGSCQVSAHSLFCRSLCSSTCCCCRTRIDPPSPMPPKHRLHPIPLLLLLCRNTCSCCAALRRACRPGSPTSSFCWTLTLRWTSSTTLPICSCTGARVRCRDWPRWAGGSRHNGGVQDPYICNSTCNTDLVICATPCEGRVAVRQVLETRISGLKC